MALSRAGLEAKTPGSSKPCAWISTGGPGGLEIIKVVRRSFRNAYGRFRSGKLERDPRRHRVVGSDDSC